MKYTVIRLGAIGTTVATAGLLAAGGVASAMPMNDNTNTNRYDPCQNMQQSGSTVASYMNGQYGRGHDNRWRMGHAWNYFNPEKFMNSGSGMTMNSNTMAEITSYLNTIKANWNSNDTDSTWTPSGTNWQSSWSNWNPMMWQKNGASYADWQAQLTTYLNTTYPSFSTELSTIGL
jgi:hypothetical protein